jgi:S1-C subfamily serine protease
MRKNPKSEVRNSKFGNLVGCECPDEGGVSRRFRAPFRIGAKPDPSRSVGWAFASYNRFSSPRFEFRAFRIPSDFRFRIVKLIAVSVFFCLSPIIASAASVAPENLPRLVEKVRPSVVQLHVERPKEEYDEKTPPYKRRPDAPCSGVIIDPNGFILTTHYNIGSATAVRVTLDNGKSYDAKILGWHDGKDLAVLKIDATDLPTLPFADRSKLQVGDAVAVVGRAPSGEPSVAPGIVSATLRFNGDAMQADCNVNFTSAGGAMVDKNGNLIGIAAHISHNANWGYNSGISFGAYVGDPDAQKLIEEMKEGKRVTRPPRPRLGVQMAEGGGAREGALIGAVDGGSAADRAGMKADDLIIEMNGEKIKSWDDLVAAVQKQKPGDEFQLTVLRDGRELRLKGKMGRF